MAEFIENVRTLTISGELENAEIVARPYSSTVRIIPLQVIFTWTQEVADAEWSLSTVEVSGPRPKADDSPSKNHASASYRVNCSWANDNPPQWLIDLAGATLAIVQGGDSDGQ